MDKDKQDEIELLLLTLDIVEVVRQAGINWMDAPAGE